MDRIGQPDHIIRDHGPDTGSGARQPPMLNVAFHELPPRGIEDLVAREIRIVKQKRQRILKLVAESERPARLIEGRARPDAAGQALVRQPVIDHRIESLVRRLDLKRLEKAAPFLGVLSQALVEILCPMQRHERARLFLGTRVAEQPEQRDLAAGRHLDIARHGRARVRSGFDPPGQRSTCRNGPGRLDRSVMPDEFMAVGRHRLRLLVARQERDAVAVVEAVGIARQKSAGLGIQRRHDRRRGFPAIAAEHPFGIGVDPQPCRDRSGITDDKPRYLHGIDRIDELREFERNRASLGAEAAEPLPVPRLVKRPGIARDRREGRKRLPAGMIEDVNRFARPVGDRIVRPRRQLEIAAVATPGEGRAFGGGVESEGPVGYHVDPGMRRGALAAKPDDIVATIPVEPAEAVPRLEVAAVDRGGIGRRRGRTPAALRSPRRLRHPVSCLRHAPAGRPPRHVRSVRGCGRCGYAEPPAPRTAGSGRNSRP